MASQITERKVENNFCVAISFDNLFKTGGLDCIHNTMQEAFNSFSDRSELLEKNVYFIVFINCTNPKAVNKKAIEFLCKQFIRFKRMIVVFCKLSYQSRCRISIILTEINQTKKINFFTLNGASGKILDQLKGGNIYLNRYAPRNPKPPKPN
jgi:hypothetical protein